MDKKIKVLQVVGAMYPGGLENFIMNLYEHIDRDKVDFDFAVHDRKDGDHCPRIEELEGKVYVLPRLTSHPFQNLRKLKSLVKENHYDIVIRHTANALVVPQLLAAKKAGALTMCHSHNETDPKRVLHYLGRLFMNRACDVKIACSPKAGYWMYGKKASFRVVNNAIDIKQFAYSSENEYAIRKEFHVEDAHLYGHIANFIESKNHIYLLEIFKKIIENDSKAMCFCVGEGDIRPAIEAKIKELGIGEKVILTGIRKDIPKFLSAFDCLVFPSVFEGLPVTLIEAQAAGLPMIISDTITKEVEVTEGLIFRESIDVEPQIWAKRCIELASVETSKDIQRITQTELITEHGYEINTLARWYENFFEEKVMGDIG